MENKPSKSDELNLLLTARLIALETDYIKSMADLQNLSPAEIQARLTALLPTQRALLSSPPEGEHQ